MILFIAAFLLLAIGYLIGAVLTSWRHARRIARYTHLLARAHRLNRTTRTPVLTGKHALR